MSLNIKGQQRYRVSKLSLDLNYLYNLQKPRFDTMSILYPARLPRILHHFKCLPGRAQKWRFSKKLLIVYRTIPSIPVGQHCHNANIFLFGHFVARKLLFLFSNKNRKLLIQEAKISTVITAIEGAFE